MAGAIHRIRAVVRKEFRHIFRDKVNCVLLFLMPAFILLMFGYALSFEVNRFNVQVCNPEHDVAAERLFARIDAQPKLRVIGRIGRPDQIDRAFERGNTRIVVVWHKGIDIFFDGSSPLLAMNEEALVAPVISAFLAEEFRTVGTEAPAPEIHYCYNPSMKREYTSLPGLALVVFILVSSIILGTSVNKEKVQGTWRFLRLTRLSSLELVVGKSLPYFLVSLFQVAVVYAACRYFGITVAGSLALFLGLCVLYAVCCMSLGLLVAAWFDRPLDVLILSWCLLFIPNVFLSGFAFPLSSMNDSVRAVVEFLPGTAFLEAFRDIAYKGTGLAANARWLLTLGGECLLATLFSLIGFSRRASR